LHTDLLLTEFNNMDSIQFAVL